MKRIAFILLMILAISCHEQNLSIISTSKILTYKDTLLPVLIGKWGGLKHKPVWDIRIDSIYSYDSSVFYPYKIYDHDLIIYFPESRGILRDIYVIKDTMFFWLDGDIRKGYRIR